MARWEIVQDGHKTTVTRLLPRWLVRASGPSIVGVFLAAERA